MENITVNFENLSKEDIEELKAIVKRSQKPKKKYEKGDRYYYVEFIHSDEPKSLIEKNDNIDGRLELLGNKFHTLEEAEFYREKLKVIKELQDIADLEPVDWNKDGDKYEIFCNYRTGELHYWTTNIFRRHSVYFSSLELYNKAIDKVGEDRIKKYYLGV